MKDENDHLLKFAKDENGEIKFSQRYGTPETEERYYNYSSAAGINYTVDVSKPSGKKINVISMSDGTSFNSDKTYTVAVNSYRGSGGGGHLTRGAGISKEELTKRIVSSTERDIRYHLMKWIEGKKILSPYTIGNWKVIPEEWWKKAKTKDYELIFGTEAPFEESRSMDKNYK
jgi:2',3'-cyclic-nucleotide 2'-phosphodiesterase/3'-nucleotidase